MEDNTWRKKYPDKNCGECCILLVRGTLEPSTNWKKRKYCGEECETKAFIKRIPLMFGKANCQKCGKLFTKKSGNHRLCGSKTYKEGCSWAHQIELKKKIASRYRMTGARFLWMGRNKIVR